MNHEAQDQARGAEINSASPTPQSSALSNSPPPQIPDHELVRCIGQGSYGEVWLARNVMGVDREVKIVHRRSFGDNRPFEREYEGIQRYEPISRSHETQVQILHVGLNAAEGYFYYVMELADAAPDAGDQYSVISNQSQSSTAREPSEASEP